MMGPLHRQLFPSFAYPLTVGDTGESSFSGRFSAPEDKHESHLNILEQI
jgi:hypothetical protein